LFRVRLKDLPGLESGQMVLVGLWGLVGAEMKGRSVAAGRLFSCEAVNTGFFLDSASGLEH